MQFDVGQSRVAYEGRKRIYLLRVAREQRLLILTLLVEVACLPAWIGIGVFGRPSMVELVSGLVFMVYAGAALVAAYLTYRLARAAELNMVVSGLGALLTLMPYFGFLPMAMVNHRALRLIQRHGVRVGFLGIPGSEMHRLVQGACRRCGYDVRGLAGATCPECGTGVCPPTEMPG